MLSGAPGRMLFAAATALLLATLIASSTAHALMLGEASMQSTLGSPLRVVIPITAAADELLQPGCFSVGPASGDGSASLVTASVNLERAAAPRLVVTTPRAVNEPAIGFSVRARCEGSTERAYVVLLDPSESAAAASVSLKQTGREPRQERFAPRPAAMRRAPAGPALAQAPMPRLIEVAETVSTQSVRVPVTAPEAPVIEPEAPAAAPGPSLFRQAAAATPASTLPPLAPLPPRVQPVAQSKPGSSYSDWYLVAAGLGLAGAIALVALLTGRRRTSPEIPQWTRNPTFIDTRSFTELSAEGPALPRTRSNGGTTTTRRGPASARPKPTTISKSVAPGTASLRQPTTQIDPSAIDTLLDAIDSDFVEERAVREAWAVARSDVERELDGNAILRAIEAAERDLHLAPPAPAQAAIERALEDDLLLPPRGR